MEKPTGAAASVLGNAFVGREREFAQLRALVQDAEAGRGRLVMISGDPGIGKTRVCEELVSHARAVGGQVLWGRCYEGDGAPAFWPWVQIVRAAADHCGLAELRSLLAASGPDIARLVPELGQRAPDLAAAPSLDGDHARDQVFDGIVRLLAHFGKEGPVVVVIDDLQGADLSSVLLARFIAESLAQRTLTRLLLVIACRAAALTLPSPIGEAITALVKTGDHEHLQLGGMSLTEVGGFLATQVGTDLPAEFVAQVHRVSEGNPLFVKEVAQLTLRDRAWPQSGPMVSIPSTVTVVIARRLTTLSVTCRQLLGAAAVIGRDFRMPLLREVVSSDSFTTPLATLLEDGMRNQVIGATEEPEIYRFAHALIRETLYAELSADRRRELHRRVAAALERTPELGELLTEVTHHFLAAGAPADIRKGMVYAQRASERALALLAYEEAVRLAELGLSALDRLNEPHDVSRCELLLTLAHAQKGAVDTATALATFEQAVTLARSLRTPDLFARAALGTRWVLDLANVDAKKVDLLEEALEALGPQDGALRVKLLAALAGELLASADVETFTRSAELSREAVAVARRVGDPQGISDALETWISCACLPEDLDERLAAVNELVALAETQRSREIAAKASRLRLGCLFDLGDIAGAERELEHLARCAAELRLPQWLYWIPYWSATLATFSGRFADAERFALEALEVGRRAKEPRAAQMFPIQAGMPLLLQGRLPPSRGDGMGQAAAAMGWNWGVRTAMIHRAHAVGDEAGARAHFEACAAHDFTDIPRTNRLLALVSLGQFAAHFNDARRAALLYPRLLPFKARNVPDPSWGSVARFVGLTAATLGRVDEAAQHFEDAIAHNSRMGARPHLAMTQTDYARLLLQRNAPGDRSKARALLQAALATANELGMQPLLAKAQALHERFRLSEVEPAESVGRTRDVVAPVEFGQLGCPPSRGPMGAAATGSSVSVSAAPPFIGRHQEMATLRAAVEDVLTGCGRLILLAGEPGIGKTRTAEEIMSYARERGAAVLWGRCYEGEGAPAFWPWVQILGACAKQFAPDALREALGARASDLVQIVPALREQLPELPTLASSESPESRFRLFDGVAQFLARAARDVPLAVVLDDLHGADGASLALLEFLARAMRGVPLLVLGTYRDVGATPADRLTETVVELLRESGTERVSLRGWSRSEIAEFLTAHTGSPPADDLVARLHQRTEGNPLFVGEFVRVLAAEGRLRDVAGTMEWSVAIPSGVSAVIERRLLPLTYDCREVLGVAAVIGREFELSVLASAHGAAAGPSSVNDAVSVALAEAAAAGIVDEVPGGLRRYRFTHALMRETLYDRLAPRRRGTLHRQVGEAMERSPVTDDALAELAYHFFEGREGGDPTKAIAYARRAGERAMTALAYEEAVRLYQLALGQLEAPEADGADRCALLVDLALAQHQAGDLPASQASLRRATELAERLGLREQLQRIAEHIDTNITRERAEASARVAPADSPVPTESPVTNILRHEGDYWTIAFEGSTLRLKDGKGLRYLAHLVRHRDREFHVLDLATQQFTGERDDHGERRNGARHDLAMPLLDATAKAQYARRIGDLNEELEEAERNNDRGRIERARAEIELIGEQLSIAVGLGGRDRTAARDAERARLAVTKRIKAALKAIQQLHPSLARHLNLSVKTGYFCAYQPPSGAPTLQVA